MVQPLTMLPDAEAADDGDDGDVQAGAVRSSDRPTVPAPAVASELETSVGITSSMRPPASGFVLADSRSAETIPAPPPAEPADHGLEVASPPERAASHPRG